MTYSYCTDDLELIEALREGDTEAFSCLFRKYYSNLVLYAGAYITDKDVCEDTVQNIFLNIWNNRDNLIIKTTVKSYLLVAVRYRCIDEIRQRKIKNDYVSFESQYLASGNSTAEYMLLSDLKDHLEQAMSKLPLEERLVFELSRFSNLKYWEISEKLNIPIKTIEKRISSVLKKLKIALSDFLPLFFIILTYLFGGLVVLVRL